MNDIAIKVENISKLYQLGKIGTGTLSRDLQRWYANIRGKEDPFEKIGQINDRTKKADSEFVWALKNIDFELKKGEVLGVIGRNGAGKSTLLKILSKITAPSKGKIMVNGRIASLLEVGTGFHPELTGRENIFMNGVVLGMRKWEIQKKLDEIIDFSGVEAYIDTPVKRYSSGMYVRLAFAVAAHLEPEILIVDEVLAVGDAEFQKKAVGKMQQVSNAEGRTVIFVSHNMGAVKNLCTRAILMDNGKVLMEDVTFKVTDAYFLFQNRNRKYLYNYTPVLAEQKPVVIRQILFNGNNHVFYGDPLQITITIYNKKRIEDLHFGIGFNTQEGERIVTIDSDSDFMGANRNYSFEPGEHTISLVIHHFQMSPGIYFFDAAIREGSGTLHILDFVSGQGGFEVLPNLKTPNHFNEGFTGGYRPLPEIVIH